MSGRQQPAPGRLRAIWNDHRVLWALLCLPGAALIVSSLQSDDSGSLLHISGELSVRLLIVTLAITPLRILFRNHSWPRWLVQRRRALGVASFGYAALHLAFYAAYEGLLTDWMLPAIATGWVAFAVMVPLAVTSNDRSVRLLGRRWKLLQRGAYLAAAMSAVHWWLLDAALPPLLIHFLPLLALETYRLARR